MSENFYARWRARRPGASALHDEAAPPERLLQVIWQHQRLRRDQLATLDGRAVRVLHPGFASREGGPDFRGAVIQFDREAPVTGDVEVDLRASGWHAHGHDRNAAFRGVILHVIWDGPKNSGRPTLALRPVLEAPLAELGVALESESTGALPAPWRGKCCAPLSELAGDDLAALLREAALVRLQGKAAALHARARQAGWEQALWEGLFRALGYKHNLWPMQALAESRSRWVAGAADALTLQARVLGLSGLLPTELTRARPAADGYLRRIWDVWWRDREELAELILPRGLWRLHGLRPANHPQRRLALAAHWLARADLPARLEQWCVQPGAGVVLVKALGELLNVERDEFWSWHWTLRTPRLARPQALLGGARVTDLAVNVILPWLWTRAGEGGNDALRRELERRYCAWPAGEDNAGLRLARQRLLAGRRLPAAGAVMQQGLLQIVRDFCEHSNATCADCSFPELVTAWRGNRAGGSRDGAAPVG
jgi:hypothetical protein